MTPDGALPSIHVDAPNVDVAVAPTVATDRQPADPPPAGASFGLVVITPPPCDPNVPHHDLHDEAEMSHLNVEYSHAETKKTPPRCGPARRRPSSPPQAFDPRFTDLGDLDLERLMPDLSGRSSAVIQRIRASTTHWPRPDGVSASIRPTASPVIRNQP